MGCQVTYNNKGEITSVRAPNMKASNLYREIQNKYEDLTPNQVLEVWSESYTGEFIGNYQGRYDENGEAVFEDARGFFVPVVDEIRFSDDQTGKLKALASQLQADENGLFPAEVTEKDIKQALNEQNIRGVRVGTTPNGRHYLAVNDNFYNPFKEAYYASSKDVSLRDWKLGNINTQLLRTLDIQAEWTDELQEDVIGQADILNKIIKLADGQADTKDVTHEIMHVMVSMMRGSARYNAMITEVTKLPVYEAVKTEYSQYDNYTDAKLAEEALVTYLTDTVADEATSKTWYELVLDFFKRLFSKNRNAINLFRSSARNVLNMDLDELGVKSNKELDFTFDDETWYKIDYIPEAQDAILEKFESINEEGHTMEKDRYKFRGKIYRYRPSDYVNTLRKDIFGGVTEFTPELKELFTTKGTILHFYEKLLMDTFIEVERTGKKIDFVHTEYVDAVYNHLSKHPEFAGKDKSYFTLSKDHLGVLFKGIRHLYQSIKERDANAKILTEQFIPDERNNVAGTADVLVVHGDGSIAIYDYKNVNLHKTGKKREFQRPDFDDRKLQLYDRQLSLYTDMIKNFLGLSHLQVRQSRIIPINVQYTGENITTLQMNHPGMRLRWLRQLAVSHEMVPEDTDLSHFLHKLYNERVSLRAAATKATGKERDFIRYRLDQINNDLSNILIEGEINNMLTGLIDFAKAIKKDVKSLTAGGLNNVRARMEMYKDFPVAFRKTVEDMEEDTEEKKASKMSAESKLQEFNSLLDEAYADILQEIIYRGQQKFDPTGERSILEGGRGPGMISEMTEGLNRIDEPVTQTIFKMFREKAEEQRLLLLSYESEINKAYKEYKAWAIKQGYNAAGSGIYKPLIRRSKTHIGLVTPYTTTFYDKKQEIIDEQATKKSAGKSTAAEVLWMKEHMEFNSEKWSENLDAQKKRLKEMGTLTDKEINEKLSWYDRYNPTINESAWFRANNYYLKPKSWEDPAMKKWVAEDYKYIMANKPAKKYYEMYLKYNRIMMEMAGYDSVQPNFIPKIRADMVEKLSNWGEFGSHVKMGTVDILGPMQLREVGMLQGALDADGNPTNQIPILHTDDILEGVGDREIAEMKNTLVKEGYDKNTPEFENELDRRIYAKRKARGIDQTSQDLTASLKIMLDNVTRYRVMSDIEDEVVMLRSIMDTDQYTQIPTDNTGRRLYNLFSSEAQKRLGANLGMQGLLDTFINAHMYGRRTQGKDGVVYIAGKPYSAKQLVDKLHELLSLSSIALNPIIASANWTNALVNSRIQGRRGRYYTRQNWKESIDEIATVSDKVLTAMWYFEPSSKNMQRDRAVRSRTGVLNRLTSGRFAYILHRGTINQYGASKVKQQLADAGYLTPDNPYFGDDAVGRTVLISMMKTWVLDVDGKVKNPHDPFHKIEDPEAKSLWELFQHENLIENFDPDTIPVEGLTKEELARFRAIVLKAQAEIKGSTSPWDYSRADSHIVGQLLKKFRDWIPPMAAARFESLRYDPLLDTYTQGYLKGTWNDLIGQGTSQLIAEEEMVEVRKIYYFWKYYAGPTLARFGKLLGETIGMGMWTPYSNNIDEKRARFAYDRIIAENPEINLKKFTFEAFLDFKRNQVKAAATEVRYVLLTLGAIALIRAATDWDEDDNRNALTRYIYRMIVRTNLELTFWFDPQSVYTLIRSPLPVLRLFTDLHKALGNFMMESAEGIGLLPENRRDKTPFFYYTLKNFPFINQILSTIGYFPSYKGRDSFISRYFEERVLK